MLYDRVDAWLISVPGDVLRPAAAAQACGDRRRYRASSHSQSAVCRDEPVKRELTTVAKLTQADNL